MKAMRYAVLACALTLSMSGLAMAEKGKVKPTKASGFQCGKSKCGQMNSCEEAYFHLQQCGQKRLDRDRDGIPCESIC